MPGKLNMKERNSREKAGWPLSPHLLKGWSLSKLLMPICLWGSVGEWMSSMANILIFGCIKNFWGCKLSIGNVALSLDHQSQFLRSAGPIQLCFKEQETVVF